MRLKILDSGYSLGIKVLFKFMGMVSRHPVPDAAKLVFCRSNFYGLPMKKFTMKPCVDDLLGLWEIVN